MAASPWIISAREDGAWFIGSALVGYLALGLLAAGAPFAPLYLFWLFVVDGPHVYATASRTYLDREARRTLGPWLWVLAPACLAGPLFVAAGAAELFFFLAVSWQVFHVVKQHFGFVMLYKAKARERSRLDFWADRAFLLVSLLLPYARYCLAARLPGWLDALVLVAYAALAVLWVLRQVQIRAALVWPKIALLAVTVPLYWLAFGYASATGAILVASLPLGLFHGLQYHRLLWLHNRNRYSAPGSAARHGAAVLVARRLGYYVALAVGLHALVAFPVLATASPYLVALSWGPAFAHYLLDAKIWHVRGDKALAKALHL
jgi:hypothetical protein